MPFRVVQLPEGPLVEGSRSLPAPVVSPAATELIEACFGAETNRALLYPENLPAAFFDLSSRQAGELLQALRKYGIRLAVVVPPEGIATSHRFGEMVAEERRGRDFAVFEDRAAAEAWLMDRMA